MARFLIVEARFYSHLNDMLIAGARGALEDAGHDVDVVTVPGALEVPGAIALAVESGRYDGFVAIGVVIRGETYHFEIVAGESARAIMALTMILWMGAQLFGASLGLPPGFVFFFDAIALVVFVGALAATFRIWQKRRDERK